MKKTATILVMMLGLRAAAQPAISSLSAYSGAPGAVITITGSGFNTSPANNIVYFGATRATVTSAGATSLSVTVPAGATYKPVSVENTASSLIAYSRPFLPTYNNGNYVPGSVYFDMFTTITDTAGPNWISIADVDGDGKADLVATNNNSIAIFRNIFSVGPITSASFAAPVIVPCVSPGKIAVGDLDGDGKPDIAVSHIGPSTGWLSVIHNTSTVGSVSFDPEVVFAGDPFGSLSIGDIDGDGKPDLIVVDRGGSVEFGVYRNTSTVGSITAGSFGAPVYFGGMANTDDIAIGDLDGDGKPDVAVIDAYGVYAGVFRNTATAGTIDAASFETQVTFATGGYPTSIAIADIDGDGKQDMIVSNNFDSTISILRNTSVSGSITSGSFAAQVTFRSGAGPAQLAVSDIDGDGKPDICVTDGDEGSISVLRNTAASGSITTGSLAPQVKFYTALYGTGSGSIILAAGDLDGDGKPDLVAAGVAGVDVLRNNPSLPAPTITSVNPKTGDPGSVVTITGTNFSPTAANNIIYFGATRATATSGSSTSLNVTVPIGASYNFVTVNNDSNMTAYAPYAFLPKYDNSGYRTDTVNFDGQVIFATGTGINGNVIADMDGDGKPDLLVANSGDNTISVFRNISTVGSITTGSFAAPVTVPTGYGPQALTIGDIDGDGKPDIIFTIDYAGIQTTSILRNASTVGSFSFDSPRSFQAGVQVNGIAIGDLDGDARPDLAVVNSADNTISLFRNVSFPGSIGFSPPVTLAAGNGPWAIAIGDVDGDGRQDIIVPNNLDNTVSVLRNTATLGNLNNNSFSPQVTFATGINPVRVAVSDIDGDGKADVVIVNAGDSSISVLRNTATAGAIIASSFAPQVKFSDANIPYALAIGDINGDGKPDVTVINTTNNVSVYRNTSVAGILSFGFPANFAIGNSSLGITGNSFWGIAVGDIDGDGKADIAANNAGDNTVSILRNDPLMLTTGVTATVNSTLFANLNILPNPNNGTFTISGTTGSNKDEAITLQVTDMLGQEVYKRKTTATNGTIMEQILLGSNITSGIYLLNVTSGTGNNVFHFVVEK